MSHEVEQMMYAGDVPWHGLGTYVGDEPVLAEEAMRLGGLDWEVKKVKLYTDEVEVPEWYGVERSMDKKVLGVVQGRYTLIQNLEAFQFMDAVAGSGALVRYHTAGSLKEGRQVWLLAELTQLTMDVVPGDSVQPYLLLALGHDGRLPLKAMYTTVRVVCNNTLNLALRTSKGGVTIRHTANYAIRKAQAEQILKKASSEVEAFKEVSQELARKQMGAQVWKQFMEDLLPLEPDASDRKVARHSEQVAQLTGLFEAGKGQDLPGVSGTAWAALNAITEYSTWHRPTRGDNKQEARLASNWFGQGEDLSQRAIKLLEVV